jgi:hypothetical protein
VRDALSEKRYEETLAKMEDQFGGRRDEWGPMVEELHAKFDGAAFDVGCGIVVGYLKGGNLSKHRAADWSDVPRTTLGRHWEEVLAVVAQWLGDPVDVSE